MSTGACSLRQIAEVRIDVREVLLPAVGYQWSLIFCATGYALLSIIVTDRADWSIQRPIGLVTIALCATVVLLLAFFPYQRVESHFAHADDPRTPQAGRQHRTGPA